MIHRHKFSGTSPRAQRTPVLLPGGVPFRTDLKLTVDELNWLKAVLNGAHDNNWIHDPGAPTGTPSQTVVQQYLLETTVTPDNAGNISLAAVPFIESPLILYNTVSGSANCVMGPTSEAVANGNDYMKLNGVCAYRMSSFFIKIEDETAANFQTGNLRGAPVGMILDDIAAPIVVTTLGSTATSIPTVIRTVESFLTAPQDLDAFTRNSYQGHTKEGYYKNVAQLTAENPFIYRDSAANKAFFTTVAPGNTALFSTQANVVGFKAHGGAQVAYPGAGVYQSSVAVSGSCMAVSKPSAFNTILVIGSGLSVANTVWRVRIGYSVEYLMGENSQWLAFAKEPLPRNDKVIKAALATMQMLPPGYPASANSWNTIWDTFKKAYSYVDPFIDKIADVLPPNYGSAIKGVHTAINTVAGLSKESKEEVKQMKEEVKELAKDIAKVSAEARRPASFKK